MAGKIMLVEDDTNLSDIYQARLLAEGYEIISAKDGEEALALAVKEHPDLIISDVMMPKISGFDMLDILRGTEGIRNTKVIMMTALGQAEDKARADKLGADRYLVKSQVTLEDVVSAVDEVLNNKQAVPAAREESTTTQPPAGDNAPAPAEDSNTDNTVAEAPAPAIPVATPPSEQPAATSGQTETQSTDTQPTASTAEPAPTVPVAEPPAEPATDNVAASTTPATTDQVAPAEPAADNAPAPAEDTEQITIDPNGNIHAVDEAKEQVKNAETSSTENEQAAVLSQIEDFVNQQEAQSSNQASVSNNAPDVTPPESAQAPEAATNDQAAPAEPAADNAPAPEPQEPKPQATPEDSDPTSGRPSKKIIQPINDISGKPDLNDLLAKEQAKEQNQTNSATGYSKSSFTPFGQSQEDSNESNHTDPNNFAL